MTNLTPLIDRVAGAGGADREIDAALHVALIKPEQYQDDLRYFRLPTPSMDHMEMCAPGTYWLKQRSGASLHTAPAYSESLDAALSLVARVLPGWSYAHGNQAPRFDANPRGHDHWARVFPRYEQQDGSGNQYASTPALALILAMLRAKENDNAK